MLGGTSLSCVALLFNMKSECRRAYEGGEIGLTVFCGRCLIERVLRS